MKLTLDCDFDKALGPGWVLHFSINGKVASVFFNHEPTAKEVIEFVNFCGAKLEEAA
jgi:hypothetical protein